MRHFFFMSYSVAFVVAIVVMKCDLCIVVLGDTFLVVSMFSFLFVVFCLGFQSKHYLYSGALSRPSKRPSKPCSLIL